MPRIAASLAMLSVCLSTAAFAPAARAADAYPSKTVRLPDVAAKLLAIGFEPIGTTPEEIEKRIRSEYDRDARMVKRLGLSAEQ